VALFPPPSQLSRERTTTDWLARTDRLESPSESSIIEVMSKTHGPARTYDRLTQPLVRERGTLRPARWDEALDRAAAGFRRNLDAHGPNALGIFSCSKSTNEVNFLAQKIARVAFGTNNIDSCNRT
jgi:formylmethanofuran dehydrogenase subunit B